MIRFHYPVFAAISAALIFFADAPAARALVAPDVTVHIPRGGGQWITLQGQGGNRNAYAYEIRSHPERGRLSGLTQPTDPNRLGPARVFYQHGDDETSRTDTFRYDVITPINKTRRTGIVTIVIYDHPGALEITPEVVDFGSVAVGDPAPRRSVQFANTGGSTIEGILDVKEPFALAGDGFYHLPRRAQRDFSLAFRPVRPGAYHFSIQPDPSQPATLVLRGEALPPFESEVADSEFTHTRDTDERTARLRLTSLSVRPQTVRIEVPADTPIEASPAEVFLEPGGEETVVLKIAPEYKAHISTVQVRLAGEEHATVHDIAAPAIPPRLEVVAAPDFGPVRPGRTTEAVLTLRNTGGATAEGRLHEEETVRTENSVTAFSIPPGTEAFFLLKMRLRDADQQPDTQIRVEYQQGEIIIPVTASIAVDLPSSTPQATPPPRPPPTMPWSPGRDIRLIRTDTATAVEWTLREGWHDFTLQHRSEGIWTDYRGPETTRTGLLGWFQDAWEGFTAFFRTPIKTAPPPEIFGEERTEQVAIDPSKTGTGSRWRLTAAREPGAHPRPVSPDFLITADGVALAGKEPPPSEVPAAAQPVILGPVTPVESFAVKAGRTEAFVQIAIPFREDFTGFRMERGALIARRDPQTGMTLPPEFQPIDSKASAEIQQTTKVEVEGRVFTVVVARLSGLLPSLQTYWRLVPSGPEGDLPPTGTLPVGTEPNPPFPWDTAGAVTLFLLLGFVLYLRWRANRPPA